MNTTIDHAARAVELLDAAAVTAGSIERDLDAPYSLSGEHRIAEIDDRMTTAMRRLEFVRQMHDAAGVHATLALAQQQKAANILAAATTPGDLLGLDQHRFVTAVTEP
jgi:hypothetical protein